MIMKLENTIKNEQSTSYDVNQPVIQAYSNNALIIPVYVVYNDGFYYYNTLYVSKSRYNYDDLVDLLIKMVYSDKEMFAIINNYLLDQDNENSLKEFNEMQDVRKEAKLLAKQILTDYPLN